ncbi:Protein of unknown function [Gryllus bimaculatus]|nr:Protein of unknown function [Gryllus bimaculatus]
MDERPKNEDLEKLQKDRAFIEEVLVRTSKDMEMENSFWTLFSVVVNKHKMDRDEEELVERWPVVRKQLRELRAELRQATEMLGPQALSRALVSLRQQVGLLWEKTLTRPGHVTAE